METEFGEGLGLACNAMATRFELVLYGQAPDQLRAAGEEALEEIVRMDRLLSLYQPSSELSWLNANAATSPVPVSAAMLKLLIRATRLSELTEGAFDVTVAPLMRCWGLASGAGRIPSETERDAALQIVGMDLVEIDERAGTVQFSRPGVTLDLGAIGKGYGVDQAITVLRDAGVKCALLHGGSSTVYGLGAPPEGGAWNIEVPGPPAGSVPFEDTLFTLTNRALSVSAPHGKYFEVAGRRFGHVIDPRIGEPVEHTYLAAVATDTGTESDALSTALLVGGPSMVATIERYSAGISGIMYVHESGSGYERLRFGMADQCGAGRPEI